LYLGSKDREVIGFDRSAKRIEVARSVSRDNCRLSFEVGDVNDVPLGSLQTVTLIDLLHHMPYDSQKQLLDKLAARLQPGGVLIIKDLEKAPYWKYVFHYIQDTISYHGARLYFRSAAEMFSLVEPLGFAVKTTSLASGYPHPHVLYTCIRNEANVPPTKEGAAS
jgi:2-polyprenyl-3-methyl-5-hydroxy-6-metoxy-1,4-benzoquinol methylase